MHVQIKLWVFLAAAVFLFRDVDGRRLVVGCRWSLLSAANAQSMCRMIATYEYLIADIGNGGLFLCVAGGIFWAAVECRIWFLWYAQLVVITRFIN